VLADGRLYTLSVAGPPHQPACQWRFLCCPWRPDDGATRRITDEDEDLDIEELEASLCVGGEFAYMFWAAEGIRAVCLRTGAPSVRIDAAGGAPDRSLVYLWVARPPPPGGQATDVILRLWAGNAPYDEDTDRPARVPGFVTTNQAAHADLWTCDRGAWQQMWPPAKGGGGVPPPTRGEALCLQRPGGALLLGGYSETLPRRLSFSGGAPVTMGYRYLNDAVVFAENHGGDADAEKTDDADDNDNRQRCGWRSRR
jgi:hypothetical protein